MSEAMWVATATQWPADGETVLVKTASGTTEHRMTFRAHPAPRWKPESIIVSDLDWYAYWKPLQPERRHATSAEHTASP